jgi:hypothetical protein
VRAVAAVQLGAALLAKARRAHRRSRFPYTARPCRRRLALAARVERARVVQAALLEPPVTRALPVRAQVVRVVQQELRLQLGAAVT